MPEYRVPGYVASNARRGLNLREFAGNVTPRTVREAGRMADGFVDLDKAVRMAAWFARHAQDLNTADADAYLAGERTRPTPGQVAWLLWGGDLSRANRDRAQRWAARLVERERNADG